MWGRLVSLTLLRLQSRETCRPVPVQQPWCREVKVTASVSLTKPGLAPHGQQGLAIGCNNGFSAGELHCILSQTTFLLSILSHYSPKLWSYFYLQNVKDHGHISQVWNNWNKYVSLRCTIHSKFCDKWFICRNIMHNIIDIPPLKLKNLITLDWHSPA